MEPAEFIEVPEFFCGGVFKIDHVDLILKNAYRFAELPFYDQIDGGRTQASAKKTVLACRDTAALDVS